MRTRMGDRVEEVASKMAERGYSQVPVFDSDGLMGMLAERRIIELKKPYETLRVEEAMEETAIVPRRTPYSTVILLVNQFQAVLVQDGGEIVGIITATDLLGHRPKSLSTKK